MGISFWKIRFCGIFNRLTGCWLAGGVIKNFRQFGFICYCLRLGLDMVYNLSSWFLSKLSRLQSYVVAECFVGIGFEYAGVCKLATILVYFWK